MALYFTLQVNGYIERAEELKQHLKCRSRCKVEREPGEILSEYSVDYSLVVHREIFSEYLVDYSLVSNFHTSAKPIFLLSLRSLCENEFTSSGWFETGGNC